MSYQPVSGIVPQYSNDSNELASGYYLKFYIANTTTPLSMATDSSGGTLLVKAKLNPDGLPISNPMDNDTVFIPHVNQDYRLVIYRNEADANANNTAGAFLNVPSVEPLTGNTITTSTGTQTVATALDDRVVRVESVAELANVTPAEGLQFSVGEFWPGKGVGGERYKWNSGLSKSQHNGGTIIDPNKLSELGSIGVFGTYFDPSVSGSGCFELIKAAPLVNVFSYGAIGDGVTEDTLPIRNAVNTAKKVFISKTNNHYVMDAQPGVVIENNGTHIYSDGAEIRVIPNDSTGYQIFRADSKSDLIFYGLVLTGDRDEHTGSTGESGHGIYIISCSEYIVKNVTSQDMWGDGIYVGSFTEGTHTNCIDGLISNVFCTNNRRQGLSVTAATNLVIENSTFSSTNGTAPESGIDLEPNGTFTIDNVVIQNCNMNNNAGQGIEVVDIPEQVMPTSVTNVSIINCRIGSNAQDGIRADNWRGGEIIGCQINDNNRGLYFIKATQNIKVSDCTISNSASYGAYILTGSTDITFSGNTIKDNGDHGVFDNTTADLFFNDNILRNNANFGIYGSSAGGSHLIHDNLIEDNGRSGIYMSKPDAMIHHNRVIGNAKTTAGSNVEIYADRVMCRDNIVRKGSNPTLPEYGIRSTSSDRVSIYNNDLIDGGDLGTIQTASLTNSQVFDNIPYRRTGSTANRPSSNLFTGMEYFDTTLGTPIWYDGSNWIDASGTTV